MTESNRAKKMPDHYSSNNIGGNGQLSGSYLALILSAFEQLKTGRKVDYQVTSLPQSSPMEVRYDRLSREGSDDDHQSFSGSTGSVSGSTSNGRSRQSRDDRAASELNLPLTAEEIIGMPVEEFNGYISGQVAQLHNDQIQLMKDIRRRGKNKVAAQNCRRRKIDNMSHLEREIMGLQNELKQAQQRRDELTRERERYRTALRISVISEETSSSISGTLGHPPSGLPSLSSTANSVIIMSGGSVRGLQRQESGASDQSDKPLRKRKRAE